MDWQGLSRQLASEHAHQPQILGRCDVALMQAREALQILASHGHQYYLAPGPGARFPEWPKKLFHVDQAPNGRQTYSLQEAEELGPGWFDSFQKAAFWDGMETQFNGRGGIPKSPRVPAIPLAELNVLTTSEEDLATRRELIAAFRALNKWERPVALEELGPSGPNAKPELAKDSEIEGHSPSERAERHVA